MAKNVEEDGRQRREVFAGTRKATTSETGRARTCMSRTASACLPQDVLQAELEKWQPWWKAKSKDEELQPLPLWPEAERLALFLVIVSGTVSRETKGEQDWSMTSSTPGT